MEKWCIFCIPHFSVKAEHSYTPFVPLCA